MNKKFNFKKIAAGCALAASAVGVPAMLSGDEIVKVIGKDDKVIGSYSAGSVSYIEFAEGNIAEVTADSIVIPLSDAVKFTMIKVEGGVPYTLTNSGSPLTEGLWANGGATKQMEDFWIGKFEVTQGIWKEVMGITDTDWPQSTIGSNQSKRDDNFPVACVSWDDISTGPTSFLAKINAKLKEIKTTNPTLAAVLDKREFRLPNEWEWEYAAAGGKNYKELKYCYSGRQNSSAQDLNEVAVNSVEPNSADAVAKIGSKEPNALGLYDMSGNVWERSSGLGYPDHESTPGYVDAEGKWDGLSITSRGGGWTASSGWYFRIYYRNLFRSFDAQSDVTGFRLVL